jgi:hypothetical protein
MTETYNNILGEKYCPPNKPSCDTVYEMESIIGEYVLIFYNFHCFGLLHL